MAFDLDAECAKARERIHRSIGQRWRYAKAKAKRMADAARAQIGLPIYVRWAVGWQPVNTEAGPTVGTEV